MDKQYCPYCMTQVRPGESCPVCGLTAGSYVPSPHHLPPGTVLLDRYLVGRVLGEGGFGITYIGCDLRLELKVAIKEYYPVDRSTRNAAATLDVTSFMGLSAQSFERGRQKFLDEARTMARMDKQQVIVGVRDFFQANNTAYIVMEYIEGTTFSDLVEQRGGRIPPKELLEMLEPLFQALSIMHEAGLIHRDISPDNLMLENGRVRLLDFGCAREMASRGTETLTIVLKHGYAPVEQYQQKGQGPWTDIYSLCATIYFCLTGKAPPQALDRIVEDCLLLPSKLGVDIAPHQEAALLKGLMVRPNRRYQTVEELHADLHAPAAALEPIPETAPAPETKTAAEAAQLPETRGAAAEPPKTEEAPAPAETDGDGQPRRKLPGKAWGAVAGAAALLLLLLALLLPRGDGLFAGAARLSETDGETALRALLENDEVPAVILPAGSWVTVLNGALEITKPLLVEEGAVLELRQPVTVRGEGLLQIEGGVDLKGLLRTAGGGGIAVGTAGELSGSTLVWLEHEGDLTAAGGVVSINGVEYGGTDSGERFLVLCEEELFAGAVHVTTFEEYRAAIDDGSTTAVVIDGDIELLLNDGWTCSVPTLISEGVTVTASVQDFDFGAEDSRDWLLDAGILVNYGTLTGGLNAGDWDDDGRDDFCTILNYGTMNGDLFLDCRGSLLNLGDMTLTAAQVLRTNFYNLGTLTHSGDGGKNFLNFYCDTVYNAGEIAETGDSMSYTNLASGGCFTNCGALRIAADGCLYNQAVLENYGRLIVDAGGRLDNLGWLIANGGGGTLEMDPESMFCHTGLIQWCTDTALHFPDHVEDGGGSVLRYYDRGDTRTAASEEELRAALADGGCGLVEVSGDIALTGDLTVTKGLSLGGGSLSFRDGSLTVSGPDAFLCYGELRLGGGALTLTDGAVMTQVHTERCGALRIRDQAKLVVRALLELESGAAVELNGGHLINLGGMSLEQADVSIDQGVFRSCEWLDLNGCTVDIGDGGKLLLDNADVYLYDGSAVTVAKGGRIAANANHDGYVLDLSCALSNDGWMEFNMPVLLQGSVTNRGTIQFSSDLTVSGALDNRGTMLALSGAAVRTENGGSFTGERPEARSEYTYPPG